MEAKFLQRCIVPGVLFFLNLYFWNSLMSFLDPAEEALARFWKTAVFIVATAYFVVDGMVILHDAADRPMDR
jgi:hypothetical protein